LSDLSEALRLFITNNGPRSRLDVGGEIDLATIDALRDHLALLVEAGIGDVQVDMAAVTFCDATVLRVLLAARQTLDAYGRHLHIVNPSPCTLRLLELAGLGTILLAPPERQPQHRPSVPKRTCRAPHAAPGADGGRQEGTQHANRSARQRPFS
jgi:anti-sigma B factor antagonist